MRDYVREIHEITNKNKRIYIRVNQTEYNMIKYVAEKRGVTMSKLLVSLSEEEYFRQKGY